MRLSVLDLVPVRSDQTSADAVAASVRLAQTADAAGFERYWVAEHHNMAAVAATSPPVMIGILGAQTDRIRLGSGGVMLPNHAPLAVAEQFALLEAAYPGRIDLGIGRAPGSDPVTSMALRGAAGRDDTDVHQFPQYLDDVVALMGTEGVRVPVPRQQYVLKATPAAASEPRMWLLGSSMYSAELAAEKGLPYVFAHHFSGHGTAEALAYYRENFRASDLCSAPTTFLTVNAVVAPTHDEAEALALPQMRQMARLRTGQPFGPLELVEDAQAEPLHPQLMEMVASGIGRAVVGEPGEAAEQIRALADSFGVDEVMLHPVASAHRGDDARASEAREQTLTLLAKELLG
ncbi:LLM class flavin-dependent oxidoreductase [Aeromicrobium sp. IC_218]|uniref:LLM class flavin-dependent oxidoreductase n=1 Tax=Aeromicrobium sp. IC_218 TaxID=2545468 RepID=UPI00103E4FF0|nr:LLM class flavin-dependent oxidoreductase [Aeromicrobium sp. IC_218]TCI96025.1 LLM class flavin-dependent oxidoreductase [Aeromicrobium sp. IC_218]